MEKIEDVQKAVEQAQVLLNEGVEFLKKFEPKQGFEVLFHTTSLKNAQEALNRLIWVREDLAKLSLLVRKRDNSG